MAQPAWTETVVVPADLQVANLGSPQKVWKAKYSPTGNAMAPMIFGAIGIAASIVIAFFIWPIALVIFLIGAMFLAIGLYFMRGAKRSASDVVQYENGFVVRAGKSKVTGPWSAVASITSDEVFRARSKSGALTIRSYEIAMKNGEAFLLEVWITELHEVIAMFKEHVGRALLPALKAEYDAGNDVTFGDVTASRDAITVTGRLLTWSDVANAAVKHGRLVVTPKDGTAPLEAEVRRIPNIEQLCELIGVKPPLDLRRM